MIEHLSHTGVSTDTSSCTTSSKQHYDIPKKLNVGQQIGPLLAGKLRLGRVKGYSGWMMLARFYEGYEMTDFLYAFKSMGNFTDMVVS
jgi:hypothetical protein